MEVHIMKVTEFMTWMEAFNRMRRGQYDRFREPLHFKGKWLDHEQAVVHDLREMYRLSGKKILLSICNAMAILAVTGCQSPPAVAASQSSPQPIAETTVAQQLIIKFKPGTIACDAAGIAQLSSATKVPLEYVRPMSGDACVVRQLAGDANDFLQGQQLLRQHPAVEWLEQDARKKAL